MSETLLQEIHFEMNVLVLYIFKTDLFRSTPGNLCIPRINTPTKNVLTTLKSMKEPQDTTTPKRRSLLWWRSVLLFNHCPHYHLQYKDDCKPTAVANVRMFLYPPVMHVL